MLKPTMHRVGYPEEQISSYCIFMYVAFFLSGLEIGSLKCQVKNLF